MNNSEKLIEIFFNHIKEKSFITMGTLFFDFLFFFYILVIFYNVYEFAEKNEKLNNAEDYTFILSTDSEVRGGVKYNIYKFSYPDELSVTKINSYFLVQTQSDNVYATYAFNVPMSVKNEADIKKYILYQEEPSGRFYSDGVDVSIYTCEQYSILFEIIGDVSGENTVHYYLLDGQGDYRKLTRQSAEKILNSVQVLPAN